MKCFRHNDFVNDDIYLVEILKVFRCKLEQSCEYNITTGITADGMIS